MAKANQYHRAGHTFRNTTSVKIPLEQRRHNKEKWKEKQRKERKQIQKTRIQEKRGGWWKRKFRRNKNKEV